MPGLLCSQSTALSGTHNVIALIGPAPWCTVHILFVVVISLTSGGNTLQLSTVPVLLIWMTLMVLMSIVRCHRRPRCHSWNRSHSWNRCPPCVPEIVLPQLSPSCYSLSNHMAHSLHGPISPTAGFFIATALFNLAGTASSLCYPKF